MRTVGLLSKPAQQRRLTRVILHFAAAAEHRPSDGCINLLGGPYNTGDL